MESLLEMSSNPNYTLHLSFPAELDYESIIQYTHETYGENQMHIYAKSLDKAFQNLIAMPRIGVKRNDIPIDCRALLVEHHVIIYKINANTIYILRILHQRMNFSLHEFADI